MVVGIFEAALLCACDGCAEGGEEDDVVGVPLENVLGAFLDEAGHVGTVRGLEMGESAGWLSEVCKEGDEASDDELCSDEGDAERKETRGVVQERVRQDTYASRS